MIGPPKGGAAPQCAVAAPDATALAGADTYHLDLMLRIGPTAIVTHATLVAPSPKPVPPTLRIWDVRADGEQIPGIGSVGYARRFDVHAAPHDLGADDVTIGPVGDGARQVPVVWLPPPADADWVATMEPLRSGRWDRPETACSMCGAPRSAPLCRACVTVVDDRDRLIRPVELVARSTIVPLLAVLGDTGVVLLALDWRPENADLYLLAPDGGLTDRIQNRRWVMSSSGAKREGSHRMGCQAQEQVVSRLSFPSPPTLDDQLRLVVPGPDDQGTLLDVEIPTTAGS